MYINAWYNVQNIWNETLLFKVTRSKLSFSMWILDMEIGMMSEVGHQALRNVSDWI